MKTILLIITTLAFPAGSPDDLAAAAFAKCCNSIQRISSLQCQVEYSSFRGKSDLVESNHGSYCRSGNIFRIIEDGNFIVDNATHKTVLDVYCDGIRTKTLSKTGTTVSGGISLPGKPSAAKCDAFNQCLFQILSPRYSTYKPALEFFNQLKINGTKKFRDKNDREVIEVRGECTLDDLACDYTIQFDEGWGHIITSIAIECRMNDQRKVTHQLKVVGVTEAVHGIHVPSSITRETYLEGDLLWRAQATLKNISVNDPIPPKLLAFKYTHGLEVWDYIRSTKYRVDENGNRISPETPVKVGGQIEPNKDAK